MNKNNTYDFIFCLGINYNNWVCTVGFLFMSLFQYYYGWLNNHLYTKKYDSTFEVADGKIHRVLDSPHRIQKKNSNLVTSDRMCKEPERFWFLHSSVA